ncbi:MAG: hypothetical protein ACR2ME_09920 [Acidimicrobiia bacterium]
MTRRRPPPYLYVVRYRRADWQWHQQRTFLTEPAARRLIDRLLSKSSRRWRHLSKVESVQLFRRPLGPVELLEDIL